jgi:hypothetical protein
LSIEDFKYYWRFSDEKYAVLSKQELSTISVISKDEVEKRRNPSSDEICRPLRGRFSQGSDWSLPAGRGNGAQTEGEGAEITPCPRR